MEKIKRFFVIAALFTMALFVTNCSSSDEEIKEPTPKISLESISTTKTSVSFFITISDAEAGSYLYLEAPGDGSPYPTAEEIFKNGTSLSSAESQLVTIKNLSPNTEYIVAAAAKSKSGAIAVTATTLTLKTEAEDVELEPKIIITAGATTISSISFTIIPTNAQSCAYHYFEKPEEGDIPVVSGQEIFENGTTLSSLDPQVITIEELLEGQSYVVTAAVTDSKGNYTTVQEPLVMTTAGDTPSHKMAVTITDVSTTYDAITYTITPTSAARVAYDVYEKIPGFEHPDARMIFYGRELENILTPSTVTWDDLRDNTTYFIYAAVESGDGMYNRELAYQEVTTKSRPGPVEMPLQSFTAGKLDTYFSGRNYLISAENSEYTMLLDMYGSLIPPSRPIVEEHEYTFTHIFSTKDTWMVVNTTKIVNKSTNTPISIEKGAVTVAYSGDSYTITGALVTKDNKKFNLKYTGQLTYPVKEIATGKLEIADAKNVLTMEGIETSPYRVRMDFSDSQPITKTHTVGTTILPTSTLLGLDGTNYTFASGTITIEEPTKDKLKVTGDVILNNGDRVSFNLRDVNVSIPLPPATIELAYTTASAMGFTDPDDPWGFNIYELTMKNDDGQTFIEFGNLSGNIHTLQPGTYFYSAGSGEPSSGGVGKFKVTSTLHGELSKYITDGKIIITKDGTNYKVNMDMVVAGLGNIVAFKATYDGEIPCTGIEY